MMAPKQEYYFLSLLVGHLYLLLLPLLIHLLLPPILCLLLFLLLHLLLSHVLCLLRFLLLHLLLSHALCLLLFLLLHLLLFLLHLQLFLLHLLWLLLLLLPLLIKLHLHLPHGHQYQTKNLVPRCLHLHQRLLCLLVNFMEIQELRSRQILHQVLPNVLMLMVTIMVLKQSWSHSFGIKFKQTLNPMSGLRLDQDHSSKSFILTVRFDRLNNSWPCMII